MTVLSDKITATSAELLSTPWATRDGQVVPSTDSVAFKNGAVKIEATYLYADLADSTKFQKLHTPEFAARVMRMYLSGACEIIRNAGGSIKSFDGDRVMGIFVGNQMRNTAARVGLRINWLVDTVINPQIKQVFEHHKQTPWVVTHGVGIDCGEAFITRAGVRNKEGTTNHNDLISIGAAPNIAAKLSARRGTDYGPVWITNRVYDFLNEGSKLGGTAKANMWTGPIETEAGPHAVHIYKSGWRWTP